MEIFLCLFIYLFKFTKLTNRSPWQTFKMAATESKMATKSMMATEVVARQQGNNNTTQAGPFQEAKFATLGTVTFVDFVQ